MGEIKLRLDALAQPLDLAPGTKVTFSGSFTTQDGATIDAATTSWPAGESGPAGVDAGGLIDFAAGGLKLVSRDTDTHEVVAIVTGEEGKVCKTLGMSSPCLVTRTIPLSRTRLQTVADLTKSMVGGITVRYAAPPPPAPPSVLSPVGDLLTHPATLATAAVGAVVGVGALAWVIRRRQQLSAEGQLKLLTRRVREKLDTADAALVATLGPALDRIVSSVRQKKLDARSAEADRVRTVLLRIEMSIDDSRRQKERAEQQAVADELVLEMEAAVEAAEETLGQRLRS
jgi:hypothetical protein